MKITYLKTIGFRKFENEFETDLFDVTSITGGNAKGKTNILHAVIWGFLGCNLTGDDKVYIGNKNTDNCYVEIHFIDNLGVNHTLKRLKNKYNNKKNFLLLDEKQISQDELTSYYSDKKLFLSIVNSNYFISRSPADQKALLDKYLPEIDIKEIYNKLDKEEKSILEGCPKNVTKYIQELNDDKKMYEDKIKNLQGKIAYAENFIGEKLDTLKTFDKQEELSLAQQELSFLKTDQKAEARNQQLKIVENLNSQINLYQNQIETLTTNMINGKKTYLSIKNEPISYCPMCKQQLSDKGRLNTIQNMKTDLENDYSNKIKLETELQEIKKNLAVEKCKTAGIKTVMITGDHKITATAIAKKLGILENDDEAITGLELEQMTDEELEKNVRHYSVYARVSPEHKVRIVKAFRKTGAVVAMTGDGVNDAPALKNADIGISMGLNGTDVAKNASDMILTDDNFCTIVEAVKQGRNIFDNIKKAIHFLIATNVGEIVTIFVGLLLGLKSPLLAIQLLWINLVTDSLPAIALGLEPPEKNIMSKKPRDPKKSLFADGLWSKIFVEGIMLGILTLFAFSLGNKLFGLEVRKNNGFCFFRNVRTYSQF